MVDWICLLQLELRTASHRTRASFEARNFNTPVVNVNVTFCCVVLSDIGDAIFCFQFFWIGTVHHTLSVFRCSAFIGIICIFAIVYFVKLNHKTYYAPHSDARTIINIG